MSEEARPTRREIAWTFTRIAMAAVGGGLSAWAQRVLVEEKRWLGEEEFLEILAMSRLLPGANQINVAVLTGSKFHGLSGGAAAVFGLTALPAVLIVLMALLYFQFNHLEEIQRALRGAAAAAIGLTIAMGIEAARKSIRGGVPWLLCTAMLALTVFFKWPLVASLALLAPLSIWHAGFRKNG